MVEARAPGKLVITGEYAVLEGAPAVAMAVAKYARATVEIRDEAESLFVDKVSGAAFPFWVDAQNGFRWQEQPPNRQGTIVSAVFGAFSSHLGAQDSLPAITVQLDTDAVFHQMHDQRSKLGLGSSAAGLVACAGAVSAALQFGQDDDRFLELCCAAHRNFQGGEGSGVDVVTSCRGNVVVFQAATAGHDRVVEQTGVPAGLFILPVWSGIPASTTELLARLQRYKTSEPEDFSRRIVALDGIARESAQAWRVADIPSILQTAGAYDQALRDLDERGRIGIDTDAHREIRSIAEKRGAIYKTSGAGGGDFGLALTADTTAASTLRADFAGRGFLVLDAGVDQKGWCLTGNGD